MVSAAERLELDPRPPTLSLPGFVECPELGESASTATRGEGGYGSGLVAGADISSLSCAPLCFLNPTDFADRSRCRAVRDPKSAEVLWKDSA